MGFFLERDVVTRVPLTGDDEVVMLMIDMEALKKWPQEGSDLRFCCVKGKYDEYGSLKDVSRVPMQFVEKKDEFAVFFIHVNTYRHIMEWWRNRPGDRRTVPDRLDNIRKTIEAMVADGMEQGEAEDVCFLECARILIPFLSYCNHMGVSLSRPPTTQDFDFDEMRRLAKFVKAEIDRAEKDNPVCDDPVDPKA
ncbi:MAG: hypothetical protein J6Y62_01930 [Clostridia bacterium]|nr:hypothetical protein [Clostridia bacterium]